MYNIRVAIRKPITLEISSDTYLFCISARAHKRCTENGTWWRDKATGQEWTDYTSCVQMDVSLIFVS